MLDKIVTAIEKFGEHFSTMWSYLKFAVREDKADLAKPVNPDIPREKNANLKNFINIYGLTLVGIFGISMIILSRLISRGTLPKKSHHGVNRYGERY